MPAFDPITLEILWKRLIGIVDEAAAAFVRTCFSTLVRDANDYAIILADRQGRLLAQSSLSLTSFSGCLPVTIVQCLERYSAASMKPGDAYITNDPWICAGHIHDVAVVMPIFKNGEVAAFAAAVSHLPDIGGKLRSNSCREIYEEGLQIPLMKLTDAGEPNETLLAMIERNVRVPEQGLGDIWAQVSACRTMAQRIGQLLATVDLDALGQAILERSEAVMRRAIRDVPDGVYRSHIQHDGVDQPIDIHCAIKVEGDTLEADFAGTVDQLPWSLNTPTRFAYSYLVYGIKLLLCPRLPNNYGCFPAITMRAPEGSLLNPRYPAATGGRAAIGQLMPSAVFGALAQLFPDKIGATGSSNSSVTMSGEYEGRRYAVVGFLNAGQGANDKRDGFTVMSFPSNVRNTPVEMMEALAPIRVLRRSIRRDSGGAGWRKGGDGQSFEYEILPDAPSMQASFIMTMRRVRPAGLGGGGDGMQARVTVNGEQIDPTQVQVLEAGDRILIETAGGGGYGSIQ
jgi:N-methylhydantoinase B